MYCKACGKLIDNDSTFCNHCGPKQFTDVESGSQINLTLNKTPIKFSKLKFTIPLAIVIAIGAILLSLKFLNHNKITIADITIDHVTPELSVAVKKYDWLGNFHEGLACVKLAEKYGYIDKLGCEIIPCIYDDAEDFQFGVAIVTIGEKEGLINKEGKVIAPCIYDSISSFDEDRTATVRKDKCGRINTKGELVIPLEYDFCNDFRDGLAAVMNNGKYGFINIYNQLVIPCEYDNLYNGNGFNEGLCGVKKGDNWGYINMKGEVVLPFQRGLTGEPFYNGMVPTYKGGPGLTRFVDDGKGGVSIVKDKDEPFMTAYINKEGELCSEWSEYLYGGFYKGYAEIKDTNRATGLIDIWGNIVIPCEYLMVWYEGTDGNWWVCEGSHRYGMYNIHQDRIVIPCVYDRLSYYVKEGLVAAQKNGKYGYINPDNEVIIPFNYEYAKDFSEGFAVVEKYGKYGFVDRYGNDTFN